MRKLVLGIAAAATLLVALPVAAQIQPVPSHHGWDSWWHDWWHSGLDSRPHYGWFHHGCGTVTENERLPDGRVIARTIERC
jgi:hypothetical protein